MGTRARKIFFWGAILLGLVLLLGGIGKVGAATFAPINTGIPPSTGTNEADPAGIIANIYQFALMISGLLALGAIVYGAILYTISAGNSSRQSDAKQWIYQALIGLGLLAAGALILATINPKVFTLSPGENGSVLKVPGINTLQQVLPSTTSGTSNTCPSGMTQESCNQLMINSGGGFCHEGACLNNNNYNPDGTAKGDRYGCIEQGGAPNGGDLLRCSQVGSTACDDRCTGVCHPLDLSEMAQC
ncbi:MAG: hypothetical protein WCX12_02910 [Candidatus Paceibacterota bacterium]|jgi:hypothetical protein